jgi:glycosyltransferase involved in cell wall biosynthesis
VTPQQPSTMDEVRVSVIVPCYNYGRFLEEAVRSVLAQSVSDLEVIIVDDGSEDDTPEMAERLARQDSRVRSFRTPNRGPAHARNLGDSEARGAFLAYLDADDRWRPRKLERQLTVMESEPGVVLLFSNAERFTPEGVLPKDRFHFLSGLTDIPSRPAKEGHARVLSTDPFVSLLRLPMLAPTPSTTMLRADAVEGMAWRDGLHPAEDFEYLMRVSRLGDVAYSNEILVETRRHGDNSYDDQLVPIQTTIRALQTLLEEDGAQFGQDHRREIVRRIGRGWSALGWYHFWRRSPVRSASAYLRALGYPGVRATALKHLVAIPCVPFLPARGE